LSARTLAILIEIIEFLTKCISLRKSNNGRKIFIFEIFQQIEQSFEWNWQKRLARTWRDTVIAERSKEKIENLAK